MAIGIYDSGVGGLSIWRELRPRLKTRLIYFGDTLHVPYGEKSPAQLEEYFWKIMGFFKEQGCQGAVVACNTTSTSVLPRVADRAQIPVLGIVEGAVEAVLAGGGKRMGILATQATVDSGVYQAALRKARPNGLIYAQSAPELVPLVEKGRIEGRETEAAVRKYLAPLLAEEIDTLLLGCTHYPFLLPVLERAAGRKVRIIDPAPYIAQRAVGLWPSLSENEAASPKSEFWASARPRAFQEVAQNLLAAEIPSVGLYKFPEGRA